MHQMYIYKLQQHTKAIIVYGLHIFNEMNNFRLINHEIF